MHKTFLLLLWSLLPLTVSATDIPVKGGCSLGQSHAVHGLPPAEATAKIRQYARLYVESYTAFKSEERRRFKLSRNYMELRQWTQEDVVGFTAEQRELLYISVGGELGLGKISIEQLPGYIEAIDRKISDIEIELGCR